MENCSIINRTSTSVEITCEPGSDGGLPQVFILEAFQSAPSGRRGLQFNISSSTTPTFSLTGLDADGMFHFKIYSVNRKGRSSPSIMDGIALHYPAMQSGKWTETTFYLPTPAYILYHIRECDYLYLTSFSGYIPFQSNVRRQGQWERKKQATTLVQLNWMRENKHQRYLGLTERMGKDENKWWQ